MQVVLVMFTADGERRSFSLPRAVTVIGRREDCDLRIPLGEVSRKHCRFVVEDDVLRVEDLGSSNGTFQNGARIQEAMVQPGDTIQIGPVIFTVQIDGEPADEEISPPAAANAASDTSVTPALADSGARPAEPPAAGDDLGDDIDLASGGSSDELVDLGLEEIEEIQNTKKPSQENEV